jgi:rhodanese-related sulfurtransferase
MNLITREELKAKLDQGDAFKLVMALSEWAYRAKHIPGSLHFGNLQEASAVLNTGDEIVVYCSGPDCVSSIAAYMQLERAGFKSLRRYAGGLTDWEAAGLPLEGEMV